MKKNLCLLLSIIVALSILTTVPLTVSAVSVDDLIFELNEDGKSYSLTGCNEAAEGEIVIPSKYKGKPVTKIGSAFMFCENIQSVYMPDSVVEMSWKTFYGCGNLKSIRLSQNIKSIPTWAFTGCAFKTIEIPDNVKSIGDNAFSGCKQLEYVTIPDSVTEIAYESFMYCDSLKRLEIGTGIKSIGYSAFYECISLETVNIEGNLEVLEAYTFRGCKNLNVIKLPKSLKNIESSAFQLCENLEEVHFAGTPIQWKSVEISDTRNETLLSAKVHYVGDWKTYKKATAIAPGTKHKECTECGKILETAEIPQLKPGRTTVKATSTSTGVKITWSKVTGADKYTVYRKTGNGSYKAIKTVTGTSYTDTTAKSGTKYRYNVKAKNEAGYGEYAKTGANKLFLATPKVTVSNTSTGVTVKWGKITGAKGYYVYRKLSGSDSWTKIATVKSGSTVSYTDKKATAGKKYYYTVKAYNGDYVSTTKASSIIERLKAPTIKSVTSGKSGVIVKWAKSTGADGYYVYRKTGSGSYSKIATVKGNTKVTYLDKSAKKGKTYTYKIKAYSGKSVSVYSKTLKIKDKY